MVPMIRNAPYKSVLRSLEVLELVGSAFNGLRLNELVERLGVANRSALHPMLQSLVSKGYLARLEHPIRYIIGPALSKIDRKCMLGSLHQRVSSIMSSVCRQSGMKITYQQLVADLGVVLFSVNPQTCFYVEHRDYCSFTYGTSVIFQAYMTPDEQDKFWAAHPMEELDRKIWGSFKNLRKYLRMAAKQRLAVIGPQHGLPFRVSGPIFDSSGKATAAISAIQVESKLTPQQANNAAQLIHRAAVELSEYKPPEISANPMPAYSAHDRCDCRPAKHTG